MFLYRVFIGVYIFTFAYLSARKLTKDLNSEWLDMVRECVRLLHCCF